MDVQNLSVLGRYILDGMSQIRGALTATTPRELSNTSIKSKSPHKEGHTKTAFIKNPGHQWSQCPPPTASTAHTTPTYGPHSHIWVMGPSRQLEGGVNVCTADSRLVPTAWVLGASSPLVQTRPLVHSSVHSSTRPGSSSLVRLVRARPLVQARPHSSRLSPARQRVPPGWRSPPPYILYFNLRWYLTVLSNPSRLVVRVVRTK